MPPGTARGRWTTWAIVLAVVAAAAAITLLRTRAARPHAPSAPPQRIVVLGHTGCYETLLEFGVYDRIVAVGYRNRYPGSESKVQLASGGDGGAPSVESVLALEPDLMIDKEPMRAAYEAAGIRFVGVPLKDDLSTLHRFVLDVGDALGDRPRAEAIVARMEGTRDRLRARTKDLPKRRVYLEHPGPLNTYGRTASVHETIDLCGGVCVAGALETPQPTVSTEFLLAADPEVIVLGAFTEKPDVVAKRPGWSAMTAVKTGRMFQILPDDRLLWSSRVYERAERLLLPWVHPEVAGAAEPR